MVYYTISYYFIVYYSYSVICFRVVAGVPAGSRTQTRPPVQSAWPEKNLVAECTTMSTPEGCEKGFFLP